MTALVTLGNALLGRPADAPVRDLESLGLRGLDAAGIIDYVTRGGWAPHLDSSTQVGGVPEGGGAR